MGGGGYENKNIKPTRKHEWTNLTRRDRLLVNSCSRETIFNRFLQLINDLTFNGMICYDKPVMRSYDAFMLLSIVIIIIIIIRVIIDLVDGVTLTSLNRELILYKIFLQCLTRNFYPSQTTLYCRQVILQRKLKNIHNMNIFWVYVNLDFWARTRQPNRK